jgi:hypothetical protein
MLAPLFLGRSLDGRFDIARLGFYRHSGHSAGLRLLLDGLQDKGAVSSSTLIEQPYV